MSSNPTQIHFVGREQELNRLFDHARVVADTGGWIDVISGEPGIGKTSLLSEYTRSMSESGKAVLVGRCIEGVAPPFWPWIEIIRPIVDMIDTRLFAEQARIRFDVLESFLPGTLPQEFVGSDRIIPLNVEADAGKFYLFQAIFEIIRFAAETHPIVLAIEDLHWADGGSCELLNFIVRDIDRLQIHIVCTYRNTDVRRMTPIGLAIGTILASPRASHRRLPGLTVDEIQLLIADADACDETASDAEASTILARTGGNSLFVRALLESRETSPATFLPESVQHLVGLYLAKLDAVQLDVLRYAAVLGSRYAIRRLIRIADPVVPSVVADTLDIAAQYGLMYRTTLNDDSYRFRHEIIRETILEELSFSKRVEIHAECATALEQMQNDGDDIPPVELFHHFSQSEIIHGAVATARHALIAARKALENFDAESAINMVQTAIESLGTRDPALSSLLYGVMVNAYRTRTSIVNSTLRRCFQKALELAIETDSVDVIRQLFEELRWPYMSRYEDRPYLEQALSLLKIGARDTDAVLIRYVEASLALGIMSTADGIDVKADRFTFDTARSAENAGDLAVAALIRIFRGAAYNSAGRYEEQLVEAQTIQSMFTSTTNDSLVLIGLGRKLDALCQLRRLPEAERIFRQSEPFCFSYPHQFSARVSLGYGALIYLRLADWENFDRLINANSSLRPAMNLPDSDWIHFLGLVELDKHAEARRFLSGDSYAASEAALRIEALPAYVIRTGDQALLPAIAEAVREMTGHKMGRSKLSMVAVCRSLMAISDNDMETLKTIIHDIRPELIETGWELAGYLYECAGDDEHALALYTQGLDEDSQHIPNVGWLLFRIASLHGKRKSSASGEWAEKARAHASQHGLKFLQRTLLESSLDFAPSDGRGEVRPSDNPVGLTAREVEVLGAIALGMTDAEIAESLFISTKTASNHVGNILRKTHSSNRTEAARFAAMYIDTSVPEQTRPGAN